MKSRKEKNTPKVLANTFKALHKRPVLVTLLVAVVLTLIGAVIFYLRYPFAFDSPNFYAEDGQVFVKNIIELGPYAVFSGFNGYLIAGQYIIGIGGVVINEIVGGDFVTLAKSISVASYLFLGFVAMLPFLLFRKKLGTILSLIAVIVLWLTPFGTYDLAVIGTIGNLKFSFLFVATLLVLYRIDKNLCDRTWKFIVVDIALLVCLATNIVVLAVIPLILLRYIPEIKRLFVHKKINQFFTAGFLSLIAVALVSVVYLAVVYIKDVPEITGYLDGTLHEAALTAIAYRSSVYGLTFPVNYLFNDILAVITLVALAVTLFFKKKNLTFAVVVSIALIVNVLGFVLNRPGVTEFFLVYHNGWPGHFFYAGTMITVFALAYVVADSFNRLNLKKQLDLLSIAIFCLALFLPAAGMTKTNPYAQGAFRQTLPAQVQSICKDNSQTGDTVWIELYPSEGWNMMVNRVDVCG